MSTITRSQLVELAAEELGVLGAGQSLDSEDQTKIDGRIDGLIAELSSRGIVDIANDEEIPSEMSGPLATCLAVECALTFGKPKDVGAREDAEGRLKTIERRREPTLLKVDYALRSYPPGMSYQRWLRGG